MFNISVTNIMTVKLLVVLNPFMSKSLQIVFRFFVVFVDIVNRYLYTI